MRTIFATRVILEPQVVAHADEMFALLGDPAIYEYENEPPASLDWLRLRYAKLESRRSPDGAQRWLNWVVRLPEAGLIGYVQATVLPTRRAAIAYVLASCYWGRGLATEACQAMIGELIARYMVRTTYAVFKRCNLRSARLLERLGFAPARGESFDVEVAADEAMMMRDVQARE